MIGTHRAVTLFREKDLLTDNSTIELLYGERFLLVYHPDTDRWIPEVNGMKQYRKLGRSGFGNFNNLYFWSMTALNDNTILIGTCDIYSDDKSPMYPIPGVRKSIMGADMYSLGIDSATSVVNSAQYLSFSGITDKLNYGIRNLLNKRQYDPQNTEIIVGTASRYNAFPGAGFELLKMTFPK